MSQHNDGEVSAQDKFLFWTCFIALIATAFGFIVRTMIIKELGAEFNLSTTEQGQILGVGLWPFAISIVLFSLVIDKIGYKAAMLFAFVCHVGSAIATIFAKDYNWLYWGTFVCALGNGTVEAVINPVVATVFQRNKTKWLNILHAGWPGGMVLGGLLALALGTSPWTWKVALILVPTLAYGAMMVVAKFPVSERVSAGVSYNAMLKEVGIIGALIVTFLITWELGNVFSLSLTVKLFILAIVVGGYGLYVKSLGQPLFIFLLIIMMPLATTELGTDSWITPLMESQMLALGLPAVAVLLYTSLLMMVLRFCAGPIVHALSPLGLLAGSAFIAMIGLLALSKATGIAILLAATLYAFGKTFFWPTMLGVVAERFPKGGAMTLNTIAGVGMLSVGIVGAQFLGFFQDNAIDKRLAAYDQQNNTQLHQAYLTEPKNSLFGQYTALDQKKADAAPEADKTAIAEVTESATKGALQTVAIFPAFMLICYLGLIAYFRSQGGYKAVHLDEEGAH